MSKPQAFSKNNKRHKLCKLSLLAVSVSCAFVQANDEYSKEKYVELGKILLGDKYWAGLNTNNKGVNTPFGLDPVYTPNGSYIGDGKFHTGIDYQASNKTTVYSPVNGTVFELPSSANVGMLAIQMDDGKCLNLLHLNSSLLGKNAQIKKGQPIALSGDQGTGYFDKKGIWKTVPHLHIELRNGLCKNKPFPWIYSAESLSKAGALNPLTLLQNSCPVPLELAVVTKDPFLTSLYGITKPNGTRIVSTADNAIHQDSRLELVVMLTRLLEAKKNIDNLKTDKVESLDNYLTDTKNVTPDEALALRKAIEMNLIDSGVAFRPTCRAKQNEAYILFDRAYNWLYAGTTRPTTTPKHTLPVEFNALKDNPNNITRATTAKYLLALYNSAAPAKPQDTYPNPFSFNPVNNVNLNVPVTSNIITVSGIDAATKLSVQQGQYALGCTSEFKSVDAWVLNNQKLCVRHTSSSQGNTTVKTTLTIGNQSADFFSTTKPNLNNAPIVDGTSIPSSLTVDNGKATFVIKTTEAVASVQIKMNGQTYNLVPDTAKKSWTFAATNLTQLGQITYEIMIYKPNTATPFKQTGTFTLKSSTVIGKAGEFAAYLDPNNLWKKFQDATPPVKEPNLRDGNVAKLTPAEIIYYSAKDNKINPVLLLAKIQAEQQLIQTYMSSTCKSASFDELCLPYRLPKAMGYAYVEDPKSTSKLQYKGFYPQVISAAYQFDLYTTRDKKDFKGAFLAYTPHEDKYKQLVDIHYPQYAEKMNQIAQKAYSKYPTQNNGIGYIRDFQDITIAHIQTFLEAYSGRLKEKNLFYTTAGNGGGGVTPPPVNQAPTVSGTATANTDGSISINVKAIDPEGKTVGVDAYLWSEQQGKFINGSKKNIESVGSGSINTLTWSSNDLKALDITSGSYTVALDVFDSGQLKGSRVFSNAITLVQPIVDASTNVPKELTVNSGKASFVLKTTEAAASVQLKMNGQIYNLVPDTTKKSWTFSATNLAQQGQVNYELTVYKNSTATPIKQTGAITLKSSVIIQPMQQWQTASLAYANKYHGLYSNTPMTNVFGNKCGTYTFCYAFARNADGIKIPSGFGNAFTAFGNLNNSAKYGQFTHATTNFTVIPLGSVVFFKGGTFGHAAIKVSATEMISQGQPDCRITKVRFDSMKSLALVGYYAPSDGVAGLDDPNNANVIAPELRVGRGVFAQSLSGALRDFDKTLPTKDADLIAALKLFSSNPLLDSTPIIRQDAARVLDRAVVYFESQGFKFKRVTDSRFDADDTIPSDVRVIARRLAELGIFKGVQQEDGSFKFYGSQQLSKEEMQIVISRLNTALQSAERSSVLPPSFSISANPSSVKVGQQITFSALVSNPDVVSKAEVAFTDANVSLALTRSGNTWSVSKSMQEAKMNRPYIIRVYDKQGKVFESSGTYSVEAVAQPQITDFYHSPLLGKVNQNMNFSVQILNPQTVTKVQIIFSDLQGNILATEEMTPQLGGYWIKTRKMVSSGSKQYIIKVYTSKISLSSQYRTFQVIN